MDVKIVSLDTDRITDWDSFHTVFADLFGFPQFYGRNMDAWIDCMTDLDDDTGMTGFIVAKGGQVIIQVNDAADFSHRCPELYKALLECTAFVNYRRVHVGDAPVLSLRLVGHF